MNQNLWNKFSFCQTRQEWDSFFYEKGNELIDESTFKPQYKEVKEHPEEKIKHHFK